MPSGALSSRSSDGKVTERDKSSNLMNATETNFIEHKSSRGNIKDDKISNGEEIFCNDTQESNERVQLKLSTQVSEDSSSPFNLERPVPAKWAHKDEKEQVVIKKVAQKFKAQAGRSAKHSGDITQDDASSTSSCSCEDHSSVNEQELFEDIHEDLDYDEDSIKSSPSRESKEENTSEPIDANSNLHSLNNEGTPSLRPDYQAKTEIVTTNTKRKQPDDEDTESRVSCLKNNKQLKSFVNRNHHDKSSSPVLDRKVKTKEEERASQPYSHLLKHFFRDTCYFQIKSINHENVHISKTMNVWSTPIQNEIRLNIAFRQHRNVILIFSVQQSGAFQGYARMISESKPSARPVPWVLPERLNSRSLGGVFKVEWLCRNELPFHVTHDLFNPYNDNKPVKVARDGQQVEPRVGKKLCKLFPEDSRERLLDCISTLRHQVSQRRKSIRKTDNFYPMLNRRGYPTSMHSLNGPSFPPHPMDRLPQDYLPYSGIQMPQHRNLQGGRDGSSDLRNSVTTFNHMRYTRHFNGVSNLSRNTQNEIPPPFSHYYDPYMDSYKNDHGSFNHWLPPPLPPSTEPPQEGSRQHNPHWRASRR